MTRLSVIIVSYNVKHFLEECLYSVTRAANSSSPPDTEVIVVDNNSPDDSAEMVSRKFPGVRLIANKENTGYSKANNQGIRASSGKYILLLNPDTFIAEDTLVKIAGFMDAHPDAGAVGVRMLDGSGRFLPESRRSFPGLWEAFCRLCGLSSLFPKSRLFGRYHLGYLAETETAKVDVLSGAFMLLRKEALDKTGLLDEDFFMYGEDIDLSWRIIKAGYHNYYFPGTTIIHFKGESTRKGTLNYVRMFYSAMIIFARKHFPAGNARIMTVLLNTAILFRGAAAYLYRLAAGWLMPAADAGLAWLCMLLLKDFWENNVKGSRGYYPAEYLYINVPLYIVIWLGAVYFSGGYDRPFRSYRFLRGFAAGTVLIAAVYGFLEEEYRFSRAMILAGAAMSFLALTGVRMLINFSRTGRMSPDERTAKRLVIAGSREEAGRVLALLNRADADIRYLGYISLQEDEPEGNCLGHVDRLPELLKIYRASEVIFCAKDIPHDKIIRWMAAVRKTEFKIISGDSTGIVGSSSKETTGELYGFDINPALGTPMGRRNKRVFDVMSCIILLLSSPLALWFVRSRTGFLINMVKVLSGSRTWVGYAGAPGLPPVKPPVIQVAGYVHDNRTAERLNFLYARDYKAGHDLRIMWDNFSGLGDALQPKNRKPENG